MTCGSNTLAAADMTELEAYERLDDLGVKPEQVKDGVKAASDSKARLDNAKREIFRILLERR